MSAESPRARHAELCNAYAAVSTYWLPGTTLAAIVARRDDGTVRVAEVLEADGRELDVDDAIDALAEARRRAQRAEELASSNLAAYLARHRGALNFAELERRTGIGRSTLNWLANETARAA
jgi:hypothetical protein